MTVEKVVSRLVSGLARLRKSLKGVTHASQESIHVLENVIAFLCSVKESNQAQSKFPELTTDLSSMQEICLGFIGECWEEPDFLENLHTLHSIAKSCLEKVGIVAVDSVPKFKEEISFNELPVGISTMRGILQHPHLGNIEVGVETPSRIQDSSDLEFQAAETSDWIQDWAGLHHAELSRPLEDAIKHLASLRHPNINPLLGTYHEDLQSPNTTMQTCTVFPWVEGGSVRESIDAGKRLPVLKILLGVAKALQYLHDYKHISCHLNAGNILLTQRGDPLLRLLPVWLLCLPEDRRYAAQGVSWMSPEILLGDQATDKSDVYAYGMTIAEILTHKVPFHKFRTQGGIILSVFEGKRPSVDDVVTRTAPYYWRRLWDIASECWADEPNDRPTMEEIIGRLEKLRDTKMQEIPDISLQVTKTGGTRVYGGSCKVYTGWHDTVGKVALRRPLAQQRSKNNDERFWREMVIWMKLQHRNINPLLGIFWDDDMYHMVSPWAENGSVASCITKNFPFNGLTVLIGVAQAITYLHKCDIVHADLKLDNVLLTSDGEARLTDFGLAKLLDPDNNTSRSMKGAGSVHWQAPEVLAGEPRSKSGDVWGFGMTIAELLIRKPPFWKQDMTPSQVIYLIAIKDERPRREAVDIKHAPSHWQRLWEIAEDCWQKEPSKRPEMSAIASRLISLKATH